MLWKPKLLPHHHHFHHHHRPLQDWSRWTHVSDEQPKPTHALSITSGSDPLVSFHNRLITLYSNSGHLPLARKLFDTMPLKTAASYNSMISACSRNGHVDESLLLISQMLGSGVRPTEYSFGGVLASPYAAVQHGVWLQPLMLKSGLLQVEGYSVTTLVGLYGRHGRFDEALKLLEEVPAPGVVVWNSVIAVFAKWGLVEDCLVLFREFWRGGVEPSEGTFLSVLVAIRSKDCAVCGEQFHGLVIRTGMDSWTAVANALVHVYSICSAAQIAERLFGGMSNRDFVSWNTMIAAFSKSDRPARALELYFGMVLEGFCPSESTFASAISACAGLDSPEFGELFHAKAVKRNLLMGEFANSAMMDFYAKHKRLDDSVKLFDEISMKTVVSWNALIAGFSNDENNSRACVGILGKMLHSGIQPNEFSFSAGIRRTPILELQQLHSMIIKMGYDCNDYVSASAIASYSSQGYFTEALEFVDALVPPLTVVPTNIVAGIYNRCRRYRETQRLLSDLQEPDIASWNILIASCSRSGDYNEAFLLLKHMLYTMNFPDKYTAVSLFSICTNLNCLDLGSSLHGLLTKVWFKSFDVFVCNVLLNMYAKCGSLESSLQVFEEMDERNLISWTVLITALGIHGHGQRALERFREMESEGFEPDRVVLVAVLSACRHAGMVKEGMELFQSMKSSYGMEPDMHHYVCVVDLLCKSGCLKEAENVIISMPFQPNAVVWRTFLDGCRKIEENRFDEGINIDHETLSNY